jgi:hypothetical protein
MSPIQLFHYEQWILTSNKTSVLKGAFHEVEKQNCMRYSI